MLYSHITNQDHNNLKDYRKYAAGLGMPDHQVDDLIDVVHSIMSYFVDQAFNVQTDQITLQSVGRAAFITPAKYATIEHPENKIADARIDGVESAFNQLGASDP